MTLNLRQIPRFAVLAVAALALAGCSRFSELGFDTQLAVGSVSLVDRCSDFMHRAYPESGIEVTGSHVETDSENAVVTVDGVRSGVPANSAYARNIAVECRFAGGVLTGFRWTAGPILRAGTGPAP